jgi:hypothetical protein
MKKAMLSIAVMLLVANVAAAAPATKGLTLPVTGQFTDVAGGIGKFVGSVKITEFAPAGDGIVARGYVVGTMTDSLGTSLGTVVKPVAIPVDLTGVEGGAPAARVKGLAVRTDATCDILGLVLGPLHLDLLGLVVDLNQVVLDITGQTGAGNLLGNLLCSLLGLLDGAGALVDISQLLNRILEVLSGILG